MKEPVLQVRLHDDADDFRRFALGVYRRDPVLSTIELMVLSGRLVDRDPGLFLTVWDGGAVVGAAFQTLRSPLLCSGLAEATISAVVAEVASARPRLGGVHGPLEIVSGFAAQFSTVVGSTAVMSTRARLHRLHGVARVQPVQSMAGRARTAEPRDGSLLDNWLHGFRADALGVVGDPDARRGRTEQEAPDEYFLWMVDDRPVSLAGARLPIAGVSRLGPVYTPREMRGHGYGSAVAAAATAWAVDVGANDVVLFTDPSNAAVDSIYHHLGFRPVCDFARINFQTTSLG